MLDPRTLQKTKCPVCETEAPLNADGTVGEHDPYQDAGFTVSLRCDGIGRRVRKLKRAS